MQDEDGLPHVCTLWRENKPALQSGQRTEPSCGPAGPWAGFWPSTASNADSSLSPTTSIANCLLPHL